MITALINNKPVYIYISINIYVYIHIYIYISIYIHISIYLVPGLLLTYIHWNCTLSFQYITHNDSPNQGPTVEQSTSRSTGMFGNERSEMTSQVLEWFLPGIRTFWSWPLNLIKFHHPSSTMIPWKSRPLEFSKQLETIWSNLLVHALAQLCKTAVAGTTWHNWGEYIREESFSNGIMIYDITNRIIYIYI